MLSVCSYDEYPQILKQILSGKYDISRKSFFLENYNEVFTLKSTGDCEELYKLLYWRSVNVGYFIDEISMFVKQKEINYELQMAQYNKNLKEIERLTALADRFRYKATKAKMVQSKDKIIEKLEEKNVKPVEANTKNFNVKIIFSFSISTFSIK